MNSEVGMRTGHTTTHAVHSMVYWCIHSTNRDKLYHQTIGNRNKSNHAHTQKFFLLDAMNFFFLVHQIDSGGT